jgi:hypothetical protein
MPEFANAEGADRELASAVRQRACRAAPTTREYISTPCFRGMQVTDTGDIV